MLTELSMKNFKSWKSIDKMRLAPITGLFGTNSSGKSSILQMLLLIKQSVESTDPTQVINLGDDRSPVRLGSFRDVVFGHEKNAQVEIGIGIQAPPKMATEIPATGIQSALRARVNAKAIRFRSVVSEMPSGAVAVDEIAYTVNDLQIVTLSRSASQPGKYVLGSAALPDGQRFPERGGQPPPESFYALPTSTEHELLRMVQHRVLMDMIDATAKNIAYLGPLRDRPQRNYQWRGIATSSVGYSGERAVEVMLTDRIRQAAETKPKNPDPQPLERQISRWLEQLGLSDQVELKPISDRGDIFEIRLRISPGSADVLLPDVGFGVSQVLPIVVLCCSAPKGSTIILEQPEIHLHPAAQSGLADLFVYATQERSVQIIFESHSEHLLRRLQRRIAEGMLTPDQTALYFCEPGGAEGSKLNSLEVDPFGNIRNWPKDFFGDEFGEMAAMAKAALQKKNKVQPS